MDMKTKWEEMLPHEFTEALKSFPVCYLPVGTLERHGAHLPFGLDSLKAYHICLKAAERFGGIVTPPLYWGTHGFWAEDFKRSGSVAAGSKQPPGSVYLSEGLFFNLLMEMFREIDYSGFKVAVVFTGHYPQCQVNVIKRAADQFMEESALKIWSFSEPELSGKVEMESNHAGRGETAFMMALLPDLVDISRAPPADAPDSAFAYCSRSLHDATVRIGNEAVEFLVDCIGAESQRLLTLHESSAG